MQNGAFDFQLGCGRHQVALAVFGLFSFNNSTEAMIRDNTLDDLWNVSCKEIPNQDTYSVYVLKHERPEATQPLMNIVAWTLDHEPTEDERKAIVEMLKSSTNDAEASQGQFIVVFSRDNSSIKPDTLADLLAKHIPALPNQTREIFWVVVQGRMVAALPALLKKLSRPAQITAVLLPEAELTVLPVQIKEPSLFTESLSSARSRLPLEGEEGMVINIDSSLPTAKLYYLLNGKNDKLPQSLSPSLLTSDTTFSRSSHGAFYVSIDKLISESTVEVVDLLDIIKNLPNLILEASNYNINRNLHARIINLDKSFITINNTVSCLLSSPLNSDVPKYRDNDMAEDAQDLENEISEKVRKEYKELFPKAPNLQPQWSYTQCFMQWLGSLVSRRNQ